MTAACWRGRYGHLVLLVLVVLEGKLFDLALSFLATVGSAGLHASKLNLKLSDAGLELGHGSLASSWQTHWH